MREPLEGLGPEVGLVTRFLLYPLLRFLRLLKKRLAISRKLDSATFKWCLADFVVACSV